jgi:hypothetical protein
MDSGRVLGRVVATVEGFQEPLLLMLFMKDGYADTLKDAAIDDGHRPRNSAI